MKNEQLVEEIKNGYHVTENMQILYENNLPLIKRFIKPYTFCESEEDLLQEAFFALWKAVQHYNSSADVLFMTYAEHWVKQHIGRYVKTCCTTLKIPQKQRKEISRYRKTVEELQQEYGRLLTDGEVSERLELPLSEIRDIKIAMHGVAALDAPLKTDEEMCLSDTLKADYSLENDVIDKISDERIKNELWAIVERYTDKEQGRVLEDYYRNNKTMPQISGETGYSINQVRKYKTEGLHRLRIGEARKELEEKFEIISALVYRTGLTRFKERGSAVEYMAIRKMDLEQRIKGIRP